MNAYASVTATRAITNATRGYIVGKLSLLLAQALFGGCCPKFILSHGCSTPMNHDYPVRQLPVSFASFLLDGRPVDWFCQHPEYVCARAEYCLYERAP